MWLLKQNDSTFGNYIVEDSYKRVEFQNRGSTHEHIFLWLKDAPNFDSNKNSIAQNNNCTKTSLISLLLVNMMKITHIWLFFGIDTVVEKIIKPLENMI